MKLLDITVDAAPEDRPELTRENGKFATIWLDHYGGKLAVAVETVPEMLPFLQELAKAALHLCQVIEAKAAEEGGAS